MEQMEKSEAYQETEIGCLPREWGINKFEDCLSDEKVRVGKIQKNQYKKVGKYPIVDQSQELIAGYWDDPADVYASTLPIIIFGDHTRAFKYVDFDFVSGPDGTKILILNSSVVFPKFLFFYLKLLNIPSRGYNRHYSLLKEHYIPTPPLPEQQNIASILSTVQEAQQATDRVINSLMELKKSLMKHLFTYGAVKFEDADKVKLKETEIGLLPENWEVKALGQVNTEKTKNLDPSTQKETTFEYYSIPAYQEYGKPIFVKGSEILSQKKVLKENMVLFGKLNPRVEKVWIVKNYSTYPKIGSGEWITILTNPKDVDPNYVYRLQWSNFVMPIAKTMVTGSTPSRQRVDPTSFYKIKIPLPTLTEQQQIASMFAAVDGKIEAEGQKAKALAELFNSLLKNLMTAKIRVNNFKA